MISIKNSWAILALSSSIDRDKNSLSLFDILEEITIQLAGPVPEQFAFPVNMELISLWEREQVGENVELKFKFLLKDPNGKILSESEGVLKMEPQHKRSRFRAQFQGVPITGPGVYRFEIISLEPEKTEGKDLLASVPLEIKVMIKSPITIEGNKVS
ncbi:MAG TPA: hypothetical protein VMH91_02225 [Candidatus Paceibacterota bacterium]|nr:hypothetical protein [Candidatus Paceibacterota bacterium]